MDHGSTLSRIEPLGGSHGAEEIGLIGSGGRGCHPADDDTRVLHMAWHTTDGNSSGTLGA